MQKCLEVKRAVRDTSKGDLSGCFITSRGAGTLDDDGAR